MENNALPGTVTVTADVTITQADLVTEMDSGLYRKNVMKTLSVKPAKKALAYVAKNTDLTNIMHATIGLNTEVGELLKTLRPFLDEGVQFKNINKFGADGLQIELGDCAYYLAVLAKVLKAKAFSAKRKVKNTGPSLASPVFDLLVASTDMLDIVKKTFHGTKEMDVEKEVVTPKTGEKNKKMVVVLDKPAQLLVDDERKQKLVELLAKAQEAHAACCLTFMDTPLGPIQYSNIKKLETRFPAGTFDMVAAENKDPEAEAEAVQASSPAAAVAA